MTPSRSAVAVQRRTPRVPHHDEEQDEPLPRRPRRTWLTWRTALLGAVVTCAIGFYAGVRVEKGQLSATSRTVSLPTAGARTGAAASSRAGGLAPGGAAAPGGATFGTVQSVNGKTLVVSETSGDTVKVRLASSTTVKKTQAVRRSAVRPGDTVIVQGAANAKGTVVASSLTDSGSGGGASGGRSGGSAVGSLFSGG